MTGGEVPTKQANTNLLSNNHLSSIAGCQGRDFPTLLDERAPCLTKVVEDKSPVEWPSHRGKS
jgi:hypothetical protein